MIARPTVAHVAAILRCSVDQLGAQYQSNAAAHYATAARCERRRESFHGYTAEQWRAMARDAHERYLQCEDYIGAQLDDIAHAAHGGQS